MEYVESIIADVHRLGLEYKEPITYTSDYFPQLLDLAERLIKAGTLYADDTPVEQMRAVRVLSFNSSAGQHDADCLTSSGKAMDANLLVTRRRCKGKELQYPSSFAVVAQPAEECNNCRCPEIVCVALFSRCASCTT